MKAPPLRNDEIVGRAESFIDEFAKLRGGRRGLLTQGLQFDRVYEEFVYPNYGIVLDEKKALGVDETGRKILGYFEPSTNTAFIDVSLRDDPRRTFTLWHEVAGHGILQGDWLRSQIECGVVTTEQDLSPDTIDVLERQANLFATHAAAPSWLVDAMIVRVFHPTKPFLYFGPCTYWLEANGRSSPYHIFSFDDLCQTIAWRMQEYFGNLSKEALGYRVRDSGWVRDKSLPALKLFRRSRAPASVQRELALT